MDCARRTALALANFITINANSANKVVPRHLSLTRQMCRPPHAASRTRPAGHRDRRPTCMPNEQKIIKRHRKHQVRAFSVFCDKQVFAAAVARPESNVKVGTHYYGFQQINNTSKNICHILKNYVITVSSPTRAQVRHARRYEPSYEFIYLGTQFVVSFTFDAR